MNDSRERFGLWLSDFVNKHGYPPDIDEAWKAADRQALERAVKACAPTFQNVDLSVAFGAQECQDAIRALIEQSAKEPR